MRGAGLLPARVPVAVGVVDEATAGQPVEVTVRIAADRLLQLTGGEVQLVRTTALTRSERQWMGAGETVSRRDITVTSGVGLDVAGRLRPGQHLVRRVTLPVPAEEATIAGQLVQRDYAVRVRIRAEGQREAVCAAAVRVGSSAPGRAWVAETPPVVRDAGCAVIGIPELSSRRLVGGVPLRGVLTVDPCETGRTRGLRVELVLDERVPARVDEPLEEDRAASTVVVTEQLVEHVDLEPGRVQRLPFHLPVPDRLPAPSMSDPHFTLRWLLRAVLDRPVWSDPVTTVELWGTTAP